MATLIQCIRCDRKLRVQDHLLGKLIKCPNCQTKFQAQQDAGEPAMLSSPDSATALAVSDETTPLPPVQDADSEVPPVQAVPATNSGSPPPSKNVIARAPALPTATSATLPPPAIAAPPPPPEVFEAPPFKVFGIVAAILLAAGLFGFIVGCLIGAAVAR